MTTINDAYINALLADATYTLKENQGYTGDELKVLKSLKERMTAPLAKYIGNNFTVVTHKDTNDLFGSGFDATVWRDKTGKTYVSMTGSEDIAHFLTNSDLEQVTA